jgi:hypothetical protein
VPTDPTRGGLARCEPNQLTAPSVRRDPGATDATASSPRSAGADESSASSASEHAGAGRRRGGQLAWMIDYPAGYLARRGTDEAAEAEVAPARFFFVWFVCGVGGESASAGVVLRLVFVDVLSLPPSACPHSLSLISFSLLQRLLDPALAAGKVGTAAAFTWQLMGRHAPRPRHALPFDSSRRPWRWRLPVHQWEECELHSSVILGTECRLPPAHAT